MNNKYTAEEMLDFIERNDAQLTHATSEDGTAKEWRCKVYGQHFASPDIRERVESTGFGCTAIESIHACMSREGHGYVPPENAVVGIPMGLAGR
jgi:hypothetical protein